MPDGRTSFQALQNAFSGSPATLRYFAFDLLALDGADLRLPLEERKARLRAIIPATGVVKYSDPVIGRGDEMFRAACKQGLEGIISKKRGALIRPAGAARG